MSRSSYQQVFLDRQADQIERTLSSLSLPARVHGGYIGEDRIRYRLTPVSGTRPQAVAQAAEQVADALGVTQISVAREPQGLAIDVPVSPAYDLRLLPLLHAMEDLSSLAVVLGMSQSGSPLAYYLSQPTTWHFLVQGPAGSGKSELLRTSVLSLALTGRRSEIQFMGIDMSGRDLVIMEALPHNLAELASTPQYASDLIFWLDEEVDRRLMAGITQPHLAMVIDDVDWIMGVSGEGLLGALRNIYRQGVSCGIHVIAAGRERLPARLRNTLTGPTVVEASPVERDSNHPGQFQIKSNGAEIQFDLAWLSLRDLDTAVRLAHSGWRATRPAPYLGA